MDQRVVDFVKRALRASVYAAPKEPGLTIDELIEAGERLDFKKGEIHDALPVAGVEIYFGTPRILPELTVFELDFATEPMGERNVHAFQFARETMNEIAREMGQRNASIDRDVLVQRGVTTKKIPERDMDAAITVLVLTKMFTETDGKLSASSSSGYGLPYEQLKQAEQLAARIGGPRPVDPKLAKITEAVKDIVARRSDGRPAVAGAFDAFSDALDKMGFGNFRLWWMQTVAELKQLHPVHTTVATAVAAAALVEGSLTFAAKYARTNEIDAFKSKDFDGEARTWKIDDLVKSATTGGPGAVLDAGTRHHADALIKVRQRIHAGRMLSDYPAGAPDLRPEEGVAAKATAEKVVRCVLDWLAKNPPKA